MGVWADIKELRKEILNLKRRTSTAGGGVPAAAHASTHSDGGSDEVDVTDLAGYPGGSPVEYLDSNGDFSTPPGSGPHASDHYDGGSDPVDVTQLDGFPGGSPVEYLDSNGDFTTPPGSGPHASDHYDGGTDEVDVKQLGGFPGGSPVTYLDSNGDFSDPGSGGGGGGTETLISEQSPSGTGTVTFSSIPGTYRDLRLVIRGRSTDAATAVNAVVRFNNDSGSNYDRQLLSGTGGGTGASAVVAQTSFVFANIPGAGAPSNHAGGVNGYVFDYRGTTFFKTTISHSGYQTGTTTGTQNVNVWFGHWRSTSAITRVDVILSAGNFVSGSVVSLYGVM